MPLAIALAAYAGFMWGNIGAVPVVARWLWRGGRGRHTALWCAKSIVLFALVSLIGLLIAGRAGAIIALPADFGPARQLAIALAGDGRGIPLWWMVLALVAGGVIGGLVDRFRPRGRPWMLGDISRLMPRHRRDLIGGAAMAIVAGTSEELFFRLFVPLAVAMATGSATAGFALSVILFAGAHGYQGWVGVVTTGGVGAVADAVLPDDRIAGRRDAGPCRPRPQRAGAASGDGGRAARQFFSRHPVLKIHAMIARHSARKAAVTPRLIPIDDVALCRRSSSGSR